MFSFNLGIQIWNYIKTSIRDGYRYLFNYKNRQLTGYWYYPPIDNVIPYSRGRRGYSNRYISRPKIDHQKRISDLRHVPIYVPIPPPVSRRKPKLWEDTLRDNDDFPKEFIT